MESTELNDYMNSYARYVYGKYSVSDYVYDPPSIPLAYSTSSHNYKENLNEHQIENKFEVGDLALVSENLIEKDEDSIEWIGKFVTIKNKSIHNSPNDSYNKEFLYAVVDYDGEGNTFWESELIEA